MAWSMIPQHVHEWCGVKVRATWLQGRFIASSSWEQSEENDADI